MIPFRLQLLLVPSVLALAAPAWGEGRAANPRTDQPRPLNLSLPRDVLNAPGATPADETVQRNLRAPQPAEPLPPPRLRFGAGYEQRQLEMGGTAGAPAAGSSHPGAGGTGGGAGRRGR